MLTDEQISRRVRGEGVPFERIRRITGYLVGSLERFNNGKRQEEHDRVKHAVDEQMAETLEFAYAKAS